MSKSGTCMAAEGSLKAWAKVWRHTKRDRLKEIIVVDDAWQHEHRERYLLSLVVKIHMS